MSDEHPRSSSRVIHVYDGIEEEDNRLPNWWLYTLYGTVVFAMAYWVYYHEYKTGLSPLQAYQHEVYAAKQEEGKKLLAMGELTDDQLEAMAKNPTLVAQGQQIFSTTCVACHGPGGGGQIGPNLTDEFWLHGGKPTEILVTVRNGVLDKGMLAWGPQLGEEKVRSVVAYVLTLRNTHVPGGKAPQGDKLAAR